MDPVNVPAKFEIRSFIRSWENSERLKFWVGLRTPNPGEEEAVGCRGSWMVPFERALVSSYRPSTVNFSLSLRVSEIGLLAIAAFVLQHATFCNPTSSLPKISPCSPGWRLGYEERICWANCPCS